MSTQPPCVCTCPAEAHHRERISVDIERDDDRLPPNIIAVGIASRRNATYWRRTCTRCGCCDYEPDT